MQSITLLRLATAIFLIVLGSDLAAQALDINQYRIRPLPAPYGFAFLGDGVTGGEGGPEVTVTSAEELLFYATKHEPYIINVMDTIELVRGIGTYNETAGEYHLGSNTTLRGLGPNATILYGGFKIQDASNVIIQNLHFDGTFKGYIPALEGVPCESLEEGQHRYNYGPCLEIGEKGPTDKALDITHGTEHVWITQNSFQRYSDEVMGIKREASFVTLSWNSFDDPVSGKWGMILLIGHSDNHTADIGRLKTTIHHNYFAGRDRQPRVRFGQVHVFNNYYHNPAGNFSYGVAAQQESQVVVEGNYYHDIRNNRPWRFDVNSLQGYVDQRDNFFLNTNPAATRGTIGVEIFEPADVYSYTMDPAEHVRNLVTNHAGAGNWDVSTGEWPVPAIPKHHMPESDAIVSRIPVLSWTKAHFSERHELQVSRTAAFAESDIVVHTHLDATIHPIINPLDANTTYYWRVRGENDEGVGGWSPASAFTTNTSTSVKHQTGFPDGFELHPNYPNPFNPSTVIGFQLPVFGEVKLDVYDMMGRRVAVLLDGPMEAGYHHVTFDAGALSSGVYLVRMQSGGFLETQKMVLVK
jgi:pectate lyase